MELLLQRKWFTDKTTIGQLMVDGKPFCFTLEDFDRDKNRDGDLLDPDETKVHSRTAIPRGYYEVQNTWSPKYQRKMPMVMNVTGFEGIRIHSGNTEADTEGCILLGDSRSADFIGNSRITVAKFYNLLLAEIAKGDKVFITIQ